MGDMVLTENQTQKNRVVYPFITVYHHPPMLLTWSTAHSRFPGPGEATLQQWGHVILTWRNILHPDSLIPIFWTYIYNYFIIYLTMGFSHLFIYSFVYVFTYVRMHMAYKHRMQLHVASWHAVLSIKPGMLQCFSRGWSHLWHFV